MLKNYDFNLLISGYKDESYCMEEEVEIHFEEIRYITYYILAKCIESDKYLSDRFFNQFNADFDKYRKERIQSKLSPVSSFTRKPFDIEYVKNRMELLNEYVELIANSFLLNYLEQKYAVLKMKMLDIELKRWYNDEDYKAIDAMANEYLEKYRGESNE